ncbi:M20/M25/M40 family metallo-hydrolase [Nonomuraea typhae]|uniref:M20/M25/M40 family metallo-hydrolase n=1 Tax=Nonomuraea typhae TaxID=2603600 RepID=UPI0015E1F9B3|nr:M20/M25/M40 family metallo-hydrolase [Nonomuraea typhae]
MKVQPFAFDFYRELAPAVLEGGRRFPGVSTLRFSGSGEVNARPQAAGAGCVGRDFRDFPAGRIAVVQRGTCTFAVKAGNAVDAGAAALIVVDQKGPFEGSAGVPQPIPVVGVPGEVGTEVSALKRVRLVTRTQSEQRITHNVLAETRGTGRVVMVGAHLDSTQHGPGINDNGSGSAAILELALRAAKPGSALRRPVRFAWWGAEELGLLGSTHYVHNLPETERKRIGAYLNLDMIASPNHTFGVFDGDDSERRGAGPGPQGSARVERAFERFFRGRALPFQPVDFTGRSDYAPFAAAGIPAGGLFTGSQAKKTGKEAQVFGGTAGRPLDACYHLACDTLENVNTEALEVTADAVAAAVSTLAA